MKKLLVTRRRGKSSRTAGWAGLRQCKTTFVTLDSGETLKRGCGGRGLVAFEAGWRCLYCGNYIYHARLSVDTLWFHYKLTREYWRATHRGGQEYINGIPVDGCAETLPRFLAADLREVRPPRWFRFYIVCDAEEFACYLANLKERRKS
ncbi:MAG: hypothetical protein ACE5G9_14085 [Nitrospinales bacterium]